MLNVQSDSINGYVPVSVAARALGIQYVTLRKHIERQGIQTLNMGWNTLVKLSDVESYKPRKRNYSK